MFILSVLTFACGEATTKTVENEYEIVPPFTLPMCVKVEAVKNEDGVFSLSLRDFVQGDVAETYDVDGTVVIERCDELGIGGYGFHQLVLEGYH